MDIQEANKYSCRLLSYNDIRCTFDEIDATSKTPYAVFHYQEEHILLDYEIQSLVEEGEIIMRGSTDRVQAISYDCALGLEYKRYDKKRNLWPEKPIRMQAREDGPDTIKIEPGERVLLYTHEEFNIPEDMMLHASPRASWNRRGIQVDLSYFVEPGFEGPFCFPVTNINSVPIEISAQEAIVSVSFHKLSGKVKQLWKHRNPESAEKRKHKLDS